MRERPAQAAIKYNNTNARVRTEPASLGCANYKPCSGWAFAISLTSSAYSRKPFVGFTKYGQAASVPFIYGHRPPAPPLLLALGLVNFAAAVRHVHAFEHIVGKEELAIRRHHHDLQFV